MVKCECGVQCECGGLSKENRLRENRISKTFGRGNFLERTAGHSVTLRLIFPLSTAFTLTWGDELGNLPCPIVYQVFSVNKADLDCQTLLYY